jgi:hypothetical protein
VAIGRHAHTGFNTTARRDRLKITVAGIFDQFDFRVLDDPDFREDSVREALIGPLLRALGFSEQPPYRVIRSKRLEHPFVYIGTVRKNITIIPDYLLERDGEFAWVLDAKRPSANIDTGKNVEQAYSYAIHRDIRVPLYGLCNGRKLIVFHFSQANPIIDVQLKDIESIWPMVLGILGCRSAWPRGIPPGFHPDMGLALAKTGLDVGDDGKKYYHIVTAVHITSVAKIEDGLYSVSGIYGGPDTCGDYMATFDFGPVEFPKFIAELPPDYQEQVRSALTRQPYQVAFHPEDSPVMTIVGDLGDKTITNTNESYRPFVAEAFIREPMPEEAQATSQS